LRISGGLLANDDAIVVSHYIQQLADERQRLAQLRDPDDPDLDVDASLGLSYVGADTKALLALNPLIILSASFYHARAIAVISLPKDTDKEAALSLLRRRSLLEYDLNSQRYPLHELVRVFALARLREQGDDTERAVRLRHAQHYIEVAQQAEQLYLGG